MSGKRVIPRCSFANHCHNGFFYIKTLRKPWSVAETPYLKKAQCLPIIPSAEEVAQLIDSALVPFIAFC